MGLTEVDAMSSDCSSYAVFLAWRLYINVNFGIVKGSYNRAKSGLNGRIKMGMY